MHALRKWHKVQASVRAAAKASETAHQHQILRCVIVSRQACLHAESERASSEHTTCKSRCLQTGNRAFLDHTLGSIVLRARQKDDCVMFQI